MIKTIVNIEAKISFQLFLRIEKSILNIQKIIDQLLKIKLVEIIKTIIELKTKISLF